MRRRNNRPIRTRPPGKRRPVRWIDAFSATIPLDAGSEPITGTLGVGGILPGTGPSTLDYRELVVGDIDTEWADANEVLVERLIGDIHVFGCSTVPSPVEGLEGHWGQMHPLVRMGILLCEDVDEDSTPNPPSLWEVDDLADGEWMWLNQLGSPNESHMQFDPNAEQYQRAWSHDIHLDLRVKRKLGRRDRLVLCHEWALPAIALLGSHSVSVFPQLRCLVSTK